MKLFDFLKEYGMFANELRTRLQNKQILVNGEPQSGDYDLGNVSESFDQGFFLQQLYTVPNYKKWSSQIMVIGLSNLMGGESNIENELTNFLKNYKMIQISKEVAIFVKTVDKPTDEIIFHKEGEKDYTSKIEKTQEIDQSEVVDKLKSDYNKVKQQLSNPGFMKSAPQFKIDAAQSRLDVIKSKIEELGESVDESVVLKFKDFN